MRPRLRPRRPARPPPLRWLFEHATGFRAFLSTYARTALPGRFWRVVTPAHPVRVGRLLYYWTLTAAVVAVLIAVPVAEWAAELNQSNLMMRSQFRPTTGRPGYVTGPALVQYYKGMYYPFAAGPSTTQPAARIDAVYPRLWSAGLAAQLWDNPPSGLTDNPFVMAIAVVLAWPWLTLAALVVFGRTFHKAQVRPAHVLRAAVYGCDFGGLIVVVAVVLFVVPSGWVTFSGSNVPLARLVPIGRLHDGARPLALAVAGCAILTTWRLTVAVGRYLRVGRPLAAVAATQVIVVLAVITVLLRTIRLF